MAVIFMKTQTGEMFHKFVTTGDDIDLSDLLFDKKPTVEELNELSRKDLVALLQRGGLPIPKTKKNEFYIDALLGGDNWAKVVNGAGTTSSSTTSMLADPLQAMTKVQLLAFASSNGITKLLDGKTITIRSKNEDIMASIRKKIPIKQDGSTENSDDESNDTEEESESEQSSTEEDSDKVQVKVFDDMNVPTDFIINKPQSKKDKQVSIIARKVSGEDVTMKAFYNKQTTVNNLIDDITVSTGLDGDTMALGWHGKRMDGYRTVEDYLMDSEDKRLFIIVKVKGGGKRASSTSTTKATKKSKEEKMEEKTGELQLAMLQLTSAGESLPFTQHVVVHIEEFKQHMSGADGDKIITTALNVANLEKLRALQACLGSHDELTRMSAISKAIFMQDMHNITAITKTVKQCESAIMAATTLGFYQQFMNSSGIIEWETFRKVVNTAVEAAVARGATV